MIEALRRMLSANTTPPTETAQVESHTAIDTDLQKQMDRAIIELYKKLGRDPVTGLVRGTYTDVRRGAARPRPERNANP